VSRRESEGICGRLFYSCFNLLFCCQVGLRKFSTHFSHTSNYQFGNSGTHFC
jgi:hypothetical protein